MRDNNTRDGEVKEGWGDDGHVMMDMRGLMDMRGVMMDMQGVMSRTISSRSVSMFCSCEHLLRGERHEQDGAARRYRHKCMSVACQWRCHLVCNCTVNLAAAAARL